MILTRIVFNVLVSPKLMGIRLDTCQFYKNVGFPVQMNDSDHSLFEHSFQGCMKSIHVDDQLVDLHAVEQGELGSFANVTIDMCAIIDRRGPYLGDGDDGFKL
ncbi:hypothetical protein TURU_089406 [Turdus rufiventris]|nr:hypothetical protein TURU_089406 [Turdus rufiventris]